MQSAAALRSVVDQMQQLAEEANAATRKVDEAQKYSNEKEIDKLVDAECRALENAVAHCKTCLFLYAPNGFGTTVEDIRFPQFQIYATKLIDFYQHLIKAYLKLSDKRGLRQADYLSDAALEMVSRAKNFSAITRARLELLKLKIVFLKAHKKTESNKDSYISDYYSQCKQRFDKLLKDESILTDDADLRELATLAWRMVVFNMARYEKTDADNFKKEAVVCIASYKKILDKLKNKSSDDDAFRLRAKQMLLSNAAAPLEKLKFHVKEIHSALTVIPEDFITHIYCYVVYNLSIHLRPLVCLLDDSLEKVELLRLVDAILIKLMQMSYHDDYAEFNNVCLDLLTYISSTFTKNFADINPADMQILTTHLSGLIVSIPINTRANNFKLLADYLAEIMENVRAESEVAYTLMQAWIIIKIATLTQSSVNPDILISSYGFPSSMMDICNNFKSENDNSLDKVDIEGALEHMKPQFFLLQSTVKKLKGEPITSQSCTANATLKLGN